MVVPLAVEVISKGNAHTTLAFGVINIMHGVVACMENWQGLWRDLDVAFKFEFGD